MVPPPNFQNERQKSLVRLGLEARIVATKHEPDSTFARRGRDSGIRYSASITFLDETINTGTQRYTNEKLAKEAVAEKVFWLAKGYEKAKKAYFRKGTEFIISLPTNHIISQKEPELTLRKNIAAGKLPIDIVADTCKLIPFFFGIGGTFYGSRLAIRLAGEIFAYMREDTIGAVQRIHEEFTNTIITTLESRAYQQAAQYTCPPLEDIALAGKPLRAARMFALELVEFCADDEDYESMKRVRQRAK